MMLYQKDSILFRSIIHKFKYGKHTVVLNFGSVARQSNAAVMVSIDDTVVLVTVVGSNELKVEQDFFPLIVNYQERSYSVGKFPGGFFRREGRPSEHEILISRLIDRSIRPLFPKSFFNDVQIIATVVSSNPQINPDLVAIIGASTVLSISDIPFYGPIGVARVGYINGEYVLNLTEDELVNSKLDLVVAGTESNIVMVESKSCALSEQEIFEAIMFGHVQQQVVIENINKLVKKIGKSKFSWKEKEVDFSLKEFLSNEYKRRLSDLSLISNKKERYNQLSSIKQDIVSAALINYDGVSSNSEIMFVLEELEIRLLRNRVLKENIRFDGRSEDMIRPIDIQLGLLPRAHGSALFTRGGTQALVSVTLGTERDAQNLDGLMGASVDRFLMHYNFPPYCVGDIGMIGSPKRREIGHGHLAKRSILSVIPSADDFPYTIRVVSEITESDGSSSMASVCGASLALMDAGVPIHSAIAGVAMGLIKNDDDNFVILSDISSDEDHLGDMDFKVSGNRIGITALQMDIKIDGVTKNIIFSALTKSRYARLQILDIMEQFIILPRKSISKFAPRIYKIKISPDKIKDIIGKGGSIIRALTEETNTIIDIEDDGMIKIVSMNEERANQAINRIQEITANIKIGSVYVGKITHIVDFGVFVSILSGKEGLVHISQISDQRVDKISDYLSIGQKVLVKVLDIDRQGRMRLGMKGVSQNIS